MTFILQLNIIGVILNNILALLSFIMGVNGTLDVEAQKTIHKSS